jgi:chemotaxis response regulator CheB
MNRSVKAALISALVFPGAGHLYLKRGARACLFLVPTLVSVVVFLNDAMEQATEIAGQIMAGTMSADPVAMAARLEQQGGSTLATVAATAIIACWIGATVDAYLLGRT